MTERKDGSDIIIKQGHKRGGWIFMDKSYYKDQIIMDGHLNSVTNKLIDQNSDQKVFTNLKKLIKKHKENLQKK